MILLLQYQSKFYHNISFPLCDSNSIPPLLHKTIRMETQVMFHTLRITPDLEHSHTHTHAPMLFHSKDRSVHQFIKRNLLYKELFMWAALCIPTNTIQLSHTPTNAPYQCTNTAVIPSRVKPAQTKTVICGRFVSVCVRLVCSVREPQCEGQSPTRCCVFLSLLLCVWGDTNSGCHQWVP